MSIFQSSYKCQDQDLNRCLANPNPSVYRLFVLFLQLATEILDEYEYIEKY